VLLSAIWGWSFIFIKVGVEGFPPAALAWGRVALGAALLALVLRIQGVAVPRDRATWIHFVVTGLTASALPFTLLAWGEERITSALASVLNATTPMFTAMLAVPLNRIRFRPVQMAGLVTGFMGVATAAGLGRDDLAGSAITGAVAAGLAGAGYGFGFVYVKRNLQGVAPLAAAFGQLMTATIMLAPLAIVTSASGGIEPTPTRVGSMLLLGLVGTGVAMAVHYSVVRDHGPTFASIVTYMVPLVAISLGALVLGETVTWRLVVGVTVVLVSVAAVNRGPATLPSRRAPVAG